MRKHLVTAVLVAVLCLALALPAVAADRAIRSGIDLWSTQADNRTHYSFAKGPIPAGFFCANSAPFAGTIFFKGSPIATGTPGALGNTDTIVQRLDDAMFDKSGRAVTRIQVRALSLESMAPVKTSCGEFNAKASLVGDQPTTRMQIFRASETGGTYLAPLALNVKIVFTPVNNPRARPLVLRKNIRFGPAPSATWTSVAAAGLVTLEDFVKVDTDGDGAPDTFLEGTSRNFCAAGNAANKQVQGDCHCADDACSEMHCSDGSITLLAI